MCREMESLIRSLVFGFVCRVGRYVRLKMLVWAIREDEYRTQWISRS